MIWHFDSQTSFTWVFDNGGSGYNLSTHSIDGVDRGATTTRDSSGQVGNDEDRIFTWPWSSHNNLKGFCYGNTVNAGTNDPNNFLWEFASESHSCPYAEVYVRQ